MENQLIQIFKLDASAGAGKTYKLSQRYINLLSSMLENKDKTEISETLYGLEAILAITFTNKAAAEMKERIILNLKEIAFENKKMEGFNLNSKQALELLFLIINEFSNFNVKTIDSFMNTVLKAFAIEVGRLPGYSLEFDYETVYSHILDSIFEDNSGLEEKLTEFLQKLLNLFGNSGFNPENLIRKALLNLKKSNLNFKDSNKFSYVEKDVAALKEKAYGEFEKLIYEMIELQENYKCFNGKSFKGLQHITNLKKNKLPTFFEEKDEITLIAKKDFKEKAYVKELQTKFQNAKKLFTEYYLNYAYEKMSTALKLYSVVEKKENSYYKDKNMFLGENLSNIVIKLLNSEDGVTSAFCRLGEQYFHYLIDEFQDTSQNQWDGIKPLVENSLSTGGTLFFVGDIKQAIYGFRGGDYSLFSKLENEFENYNLEIEPLETNYRSKKEIVNFNNSLFNIENFKQLNQIEKIPENAMLELKEIFKNSKQKVIKKGSGFVFVKSFENKNDDSLKEEFYKVLENVRERYDDGEILILGRSNSDLENISNMLIEHEPSIPFVSESSLKLFSNAITKSVLVFLKYLAGNINENFLYHLILSDFFYGEGKEIVEKYLIYLKENKVEKNERVEVFEKILLKNNKEFYLKYIEPFKNWKVTLTPYELTCKIIDFFNLNLKKEDKVYLDRLLELVFNIESKSDNSLSDTVEQIYEKVSNTSLLMPETPEVIRLMTIHKAKGLQAKVVIIPNLAWNMYQSSKLFVEYPKNSGKFLELDKNLINFVEELKKISENKKKQEFIEHFNLLYVALTRAENELYIFSKKAGSNSISTVFEKLFLENYQLNEEGCFETGEKVTNKNKIIKKIDKEEILKIDEKINIRDKLQIENNDDFEFNVNSEFRKIGNTVHLALSFIKVIDDINKIQKYAEFFVEKAMCSLGISIKNFDFKNHCISLVEKTLRDLFPYFDKANLSNVWCEKEFIDKSGRFLRIDRLVFKDEKFYIIDYKTGKKEESHLIQMKNYKKSIKEINESFNVLALLYYVETGEIENV